MKGVFHLRPPTPRYGATWPVHKVVSFLKKLGSSADLSLKWLSWKLVTLMALALACRCSELQMIEVPGVLFNEHGVKIILLGLTKTSKATNPSKQFTIDELKEEPLLCPVSTLKHYLSSTKSLRDTPPKEKKLFLSYVKPHKPVTTSTIGRWIVSVLTASGVDAEFKAHSTRSASVSQAIRAGIPVDAILQAAGWRSKSVFEQYYQKEVQMEPKNLTKAVLSSEHTS